MSVGAIRAAPVPAIPASRRILANRGLLMQIFSYLYYNNYTQERVRLRTDRDYDEAEATQASIRKAYSLFAFLIPAKINRPSNFELACSYPFHSVKTVEVAKRMSHTLDVAHNRYYLREKGAPRFEYNAPTAAFRVHRFAVAEFLVSVGGRLELDAEWLNDPRVLPCDFWRKNGTSFFFEYPFLCNEVLRIKFGANPAAQFLQEVLEDASLKGSLRGVDWAIARSKSLSPFHPFVNAIKGGFLKTVQLLSLHFQLATLPEHKQRYLMGLSLRLGYPKIASFLRDQGCPLSGQQALHLEALLKMPKTLKDIQPPPPNSKKRNEDHGGARNWEIYCKNYQKGVIMTLERFRSDPPDCIAVVLDLGDYRRRLAILGGIDGIENYGRSAENTSMTSPFKYLDYTGPISLGQVSYITASGVTLLLTKTFPDRWEHVCSNYWAALQEIEYLTLAIIDKDYTKMEDLQVDIHRIFWLFAHVAPYRLGTPTCSSIYCDALYLRKGFTPPPKRVDENCLALSCPTWQQFSHLMMSK